MPITILSPKYSPYRKLPFELVLNYIKVGDSLGIGFEFTDDVFIKDNIWKQNNKPKFVSHPLFGNDIKQGMYTDDSQMSSALIRLMRTKPESDWFDDRVVSHYFLLEFQMSPRKGYSTILYDILSTSRDWIDFLRKISKTEKSTSNGGCMRAVPIGVLPKLDLVRKFARFQASITHKDTAIDAAEIVAVPSHLLMYNLKNVKEKGLFKLTQEQSSYFPDIVPTLKRVEGRDKLGLKTAITAIKLFEDVKIKQSKNLDELIREAILLGGDTDTVAAIVSGFYGMFEMNHSSIARKALYNTEVDQF